MKKHSSLQALISSNEASYDWELEPAEIDEAPHRLKSSAAWYWRAKIPKQYDPKLKCPRFEKINYCRRKQRARIALLRRGTINDVALGNILDSCVSNNRCGSMACTLCRRRLRRVYVGQAMERMAHLRPLYSVTLLLEGFSLSSSGDAHMVSLFYEAVGNLLRKLPKSACVLGWVEIEYSPEQGGMAPHFHAVVGGCNKSQVRKIKPRVRKWPERMFRIPLKAREIMPGKELDVATYVMKQFPPRDARRCRKRKSKPIYGSSHTSHDNSELHHLHQSGERGLVVLRGMRRDRNSLRLRLL